MVLVKVGVLARVNHTAHTPRKVTAAAQIGGASDWPRRASHVKIREASNRGLAMVALLCMPPSS